MNKNIFEHIYNNAVDKRIYEEKLTQEDKMDMWHNGTRGFNIEAASTSKLRKNLKICKAKGYKAEASKIRAEIKKRGLKVELDESGLLKEGWTPSIGDYDYTGSYEIDDNESGGRGGLVFFLDIDKKIVYKIATSVWSDAKKYERADAELTARNSLPEGHGSFKLIAYKHLTYSELSNVILKNTKRSYSEYKLWQWANNGDNSIFLCGYKPNGEKLSNEEFKKNLFDNQAETFDDIDDVFENTETGDVFYTTKEKEISQDDIYHMGYSDGYQDGIEDDKISYENMKRNCEENGYSYETYKKGYDAGFKEGRKDKKSGEWDRHQ